MSSDGLRLALIGPIPPPAGGMAMQTHQLSELLRREGIVVTLVPTNAPYWPRWIGGVRGVRALFRLLPYIIRLWRAADRVQLVHVMANSGWSWHLFAAPAIWIARMNRIPVVVNYRGGEAEVFLARAHRSVRATLQGVVRLVVPSPFLHQVFARYGIIADIVPNIVDLERFHPDDIALEPIEAAHIVVARNLEAIYDIPTALAAFVLVRRQLPSVRLTVAGSGPARDQLVAIAKRLGIEDAVTFTGSLNRDAIAALYRSASLMLNPSRADNMPNSVLEAMAAGVPVVSTNVGGVPFIIRDGVTGLLVQPGDDAAMAAAMLRILMTPAFAKALREAALRDVEQYAWPRVRQRWLDVYRSAIAVGRVAEKTA